MSAASTSCSGITDAHPSQTWRCQAAIPHPVSAASHAPALPDLVCRPRWTPTECTLQRARFSQSRNRRLPYLLAPFSISRWETNSKFSISSSSPSVCPSRRSREFLPAGQLSNRLYKCLLLSATAHRAAGMYPPVSTAFRGLNTTAAEETGYFLHRRPGGVTEIETEAQCKTKGSWFVANSCALALPSRSDRSR
jgi:hypothetical protein